MLALPAYPLTRYPEFYTDGMIVWLHGRRFSDLLININCLTRSPRSSRLRLRLNYDLMISLSPSALHARSTTSSKGKKGEHFIIPLDRCNNYRRSLLFASIIEHGLIIFKFGQHRVRFSKSKSGINNVQVHGDVSEAHEEIKIDLDLTVYSGEAS